MEGVHAQWEVADVGELVQTGAAVVAHDNFSKSTVVATKTKPSLGRQLKSAAGEVADDILVAHQDDVLFRRVFAGFSGRVRDGLCVIRRFRRCLVIRHSMTCSKISEHNNVYICQCLQSLTILSKGGFNAGRVLEHGRSGRLRCMRSEHSRSRRGAP